MKILIAPDKFKGSLSAKEVCTAIANGIRRFDESIEIISLPLADGGEGSLDVIRANIESEWKNVLVKNPLGESITASYLLSGHKAYIELAAASGLNLLSSDKRNPLYTSTFGTGELILDALSHGATEIHLFVGGSATNDMGIGIAQALGYQFLDRDEDEVPPVGLSLAFIMKIKKKLKYDPAKVKFVALCDVDNPLYGKNGAARVYAAQKGAGKYAIEILDKGLKRLAKRCKKDLDKDVGKIPGAGAAGGVGAAVLAFLDGEIKSGSQFLFDIVNVHEIIKTVDLVITGEGCFDQQSLSGKVVYQVLEVARNAKKNSVVFCGQCDLTEEVVTSLEGTQVLNLLTLARNKKDSTDHAFEYLREMTYQFLSTLK